jgi:two-component system, NtrC family, sensor histidine kinase HydH
MDVTPVPPGFEEIRREEQARAFRALLRARYLAHPLFLAIVLYIGLNDSSWYRAIVMIGATTVMVGAMVLETLLIRRKGISQYRIGYRDLIPLVLTFLLLALFSGGTRSPFIVVTLAVLVGVAILQGRRVAVVLLCCFLVFLWALVLFQGRIPWIMPPVFVDAAGRQTFAYDAAFVAVVSVIAVFITGLGITVGKMSDSMLARSLEARSEVLRVHAERLTDLMTLSGEIAHELKNPLASIKGLAQLVEADPSRARERLKLLQVEVDRMRAILDEFLNFSRPLVPLVQQTVDLGELCRSVVALHEGLAGARRLLLVAPGDTLEVRCDPRKTKQILVNLVQNALEASPDGSEVRVAVGHQNGFANVRVMDRGGGISSAIGHRAFEPGVTSKAGGSGLGLTIARTLAEQHGGSLRLSNRDGGGCIAEVLLPIRGATAAPREAAI